MISRRPGMFHDMNARTLRSRKDSIFFLATASSVALAIVGSQHGFLLLRSVAQATAAVALHHGFIHRCHRSANYDAYDIGIRNLFLCHLSEHLNGREFCESVSTDPISSL